MAYINIFAFPCEYYCVTDLGSACILIRIDMQSDLCVKDSSGIQGQNFTYFRNETWLILLKINCQNENAYIFTVIVQSSCQN